MTDMPWWLTLAAFADYFLMGVLAHIGWVALKRRRALKMARIEFERRGYEVLEIAPGGGEHYVATVKERAVHD